MYISRSQKRSPLRNVAARSLSAFFAFTLVFFLALGAALASPQVAWAADDELTEEQKTIEKEIPDDFPEDDKGKENWFFNNTNKSTADGGLFSGVILRIFGVNYINKAPLAHAPGSNAKMENILKIPLPSGYLCSTDAPGAGTMFYHNCDIPSFMTEFLQDVFATVGKTGIYNGNPTSSVGTLGVPKSLPGDGNVPVDPALRASKYTALELYGYNLPWTSYRGEWDHIKTQSSARLLTNYNGFDHIGLTGQAIGNAITHGLNVAVNSAISQLQNSGNIFQAFSDFWSGLFGGGAEASVGTILDTADRNVIATFGWYRVGYGDKAYGIRELTDEEIAAQMRLTYLNLLSTSAPDEAILPKALIDLAPGGVRPRPEMSKCEYNLVVVDPNGVAEAKNWYELSPPTKAQIDNPDHTGVPYADCLSLATVEYNKWISASEYDGFSPNGAEIFGPRDFMRYDPSGNRKKDTVKTWKDLNKNTFDKAQDEYGISCSETYSNEDANVDAVYRKFLECWGARDGSGRPTTAYTGGHPAGTLTDDRAWNAVANKIYEKNQGELNAIWLDTFMSEHVRDQMGNNPEVLNFSAPWNRFVCVDDNGNDMKTGSGNKEAFVRPVDVNGNLNPDCSIARSPIQGGLFGSGYDNSTSWQTPSNDTRHISNFGDPFSILIGGFVIATAESNQSGFIRIGQFATAISGEIITWSFMPILDAIGVTDIIVNLVKGLGESLFYQLALLLIAFAGVSILWKAFRHQQYREAFTSVLYMVLIFVSGTMIMTKTEAVVDFVQNVPALAEQQIVSMLFNEDKFGDELCTSSDLEPKGSGDTDFFGEIASYSSSESTRTLVCNNWRAFTFTPWVYGQFGADFSYHYANGATNLPLGASTWSNTNGDLVGKPAVNMGGGVTVENWALYQLDLTKSGTTTTRDSSRSASQVDPNLYRIVDAQMGPNNGAQTDNRFASDWSGNPASRAGIAFFSTILAVFGAILVGAYSFTKLIVAVVSTIMLVFLPFAFLLGLFPSKRAKLKDYIMAIVGLMIQRVVLTLFISVFFVVLLMLATAAKGDYFLIFITGMLTCMVFWMYRKDIQEFVFSGIGNPSFGSAFRNDPANAIKEWPIAKGAVQGYERFKDLGTSLAPAVIGSALAGGNPLMSKDSMGRNVLDGGLVGRQLKSVMRIRERKQLREGRSALSAMDKAYSRVKSESLNGDNVSDDVKRVLDEHFAKHANENRAGQHDDYIAAFNQLAATDGYDLRSEYVLDAEGYQVLDSDGKAQEIHYIVDESTGETVAVLEDFIEIDSQKPLHMRDKKLADRYIELEAESLKKRRASVALREKTLRSLEPAAAKIFEKYANEGEFWALSDFTSEKDNIVKWKKSKELSGDVESNLKTVFDDIDREMPDSAGFTNAQRNEVKSALKKYAKDAASQRVAEHEMARIRTHLRKVGEYEATGDSGYAKNYRMIEEMLNRSGGV